MGSRNKIQVYLIKLDSGKRLLRLADLPSGLALELELNPLQPLLRQKKRLFSVFEAALAKAQLTAA